MPLDVVDDGGEGRRARQRRELLEEIEAEARRLLTEGGAGNVSMRAIARGVGMGAASLYTYFDSLDDVFTMLLLRSYQRLAEATAAATQAFVDSPPSDRALAGILAHRRWALDHRHEFNLLFTDLLPGYEAPEGGPTIAAQVEVFQPMLDVLEELLPRDPRRRIEERAVLVWSTFHGAVSLEVNHHLDWVEDPARTHEEAVRRAFAGAGIPEPAASVRRRFERWVATQP